MTNSMQDGPNVPGRAEALVRRLRSYGPVVVAFSGGVDSSVVAQAAHLALGPAAVAVTGLSPSVSRRMREVAEQVAGQIGIRHEWIDTAEFDDPSYVANDGRRCYHCKDELYGRLAQQRARFGDALVCSGANTDDLGDYRPGLQAAAEHGVRHPLQEEGLDKQAVRRLATHWGLPNADLPAAPCLASRVAVGLEATPERIERIERAEELLHELGFPECRVRYHPGDLARVEVPASRVAELCAAGVRDRVVARLSEIGFLFVTLDLAGFRSGSTNVLVPAEMLAAAQRTATKGRT